MIRVDPCGARKDAPEPALARVANRFRRDDQQLGLSPSFRAAMAPEPARTLDRQVDRGEIGRHRVEIKVERLFHDLRRHQHLARPFARLARLAERRGNLFLDLQTVGEGEARMEKTCIQSARLQRLIRLDRVVHGVADVRNRFSRAGRGFDLVQRLAGRAKKPHRKRARPLRPGGDRHRPPTTGGANARQRIFRLARNRPRGRGQAGLNLKRIQQAPADRRRQGRRQQDRGAAESRLEFKQRLDLPLHIGVVGMHFVEDEDAAHETQQTQRLMPVRKHRQQRLIDRARARIREKRQAPVIGDPGGASGRRGRIRTAGAAAGHGIARFSPSAAQHGRTEPLVHVPRPVRQGNGRRCIGGEQLPVRLAEAAEHGVCGRHGRQRDIEAVRPSRRHQAMGEHQRRFGLAAARFVFDYEQGGAVGQLHRARPFLHGARSRALFDQRVIAETAAASGRQYSRLGDGAFRLLPRPAPICVDVPAVRGSAIGKPLLVGTDPVGDNGEAREREGSAARATRVDGRQLRRRRKQFVRKTDEFGRRIHSPFAEIRSQPRTSAMERIRRWRRTVVAGDCGDQRPPCAPPNRLRQPEETVVAVEQAQTAGAMVVANRDPVRIVRKAAGIEVRRLRLKAPGEFADVMESEQVEDDRRRLVPRQAEQTAQAPGEPGVLRKQSVAHRSDIETMQDQRVPLRTAVGMEGARLAPEPEDIQFHCARRPSREPVRYYPRVMIAASRANGRGVATGRPPGRNLKEKPPARRGCGTAVRPCACGRSRG